jgi:hypothetical protein
MSKRIVLIGHCGPDNSYLRLAVSRAGRDVKVVSADECAELELLLKEGVDLLLFNRVLDYGFDETSGAVLIGKVRAKYPNVQCMLVSNYPEAQAEAVAAGALPGFGKRDLGSPRVAEMIREAIATPAVQKSA